MDALVSLPAASRLDWDALNEGQLRLRYRATDTLWSDILWSHDLVDLREHIRRLSVTMLEVSTFHDHGAWEEVAHNLRLAYSLTDVFADTDIDGAGGWCSPVSDYEDVNSELAAKHLAATIVFTFVWTAYECAVEAIAGKPGPRGAQGRDLAMAAHCRHMPYLRTMLMHAFELDRDAIDFDHVEMRRMIRTGSVPGMAGEYLRQFRNRLIHGDLPKPEPGDWGFRSKYMVDEDPHLRRFHPAVRLTLMQLQRLLIGQLAESDVVSYWQNGQNLSAHLVLERLHIGREADRYRDPEFDFGVPGPEWPDYGWGDAYALLGG